MDWIYTAFLGTQSTLHLQIYNVHLLFEMDEKRIRSGSLSFIVCLYKQNLNEMKINDKTLQSYVPLCRLAFAIV